jgi:DNA polymerase I
MSERQKLVLVDGSGYLYRAFHALPPLVSSRGEPTGAVLGVLNMLLKLIKEEAPQFIAVVFDAPGKTFRDALFEQYKAQRQPMPDELRSQLQPLLEAVKGMGLPLLRIDGVEADDVIGTLAKQAAAADIDVLISTGDKDMAQLVNERIVLVNTMSNTRLDRAGVKNKFDVFPEQIIDYLALVGDTSDNIPGIPKVGPKTAAKWLNDYGTLDKLVENAAAITGKVGENLRDGLTTLELSRKLATLDCNVALDVQPASLVPGEPDRTRLRELYTRLELRALLRALEGAMPDDAAGEQLAIVPAVERAPRQYETILTLDSLQQWVERLKQAEVFAIDAVTASLDYMQAPIVGVALAIEPNAAAYVPLAHDYAGAPAQLPQETVFQLLKPLLEDEQRAKTGHHLKFGAHALKRYGIDLRGVRFDSMLESYIWNSTATRHDIDAVTKRYLNIEITPYETLTGRGAKQIPFSQVAVDLATGYGAERADIALQLHQVFWSKFATAPALRTLYETIEQPLSAVLFRIEQNGVLIDGALLKQQSTELATRMREIEAAAHAVAGGPFSIESPKQLQEVLFGRLGLPVLGKTPTGQPSTAESVLEELAEKYELPRMIMEYRAFSKLKSTYTDKLPGQINRATHRVHTCYHQAIAATGRLSSQDPNLQNIPIRSTEGRRIRQAFIAPPGRCIVAADYSQIELRIMAHLSGDAGLLSAFAEERDIHQATAAEVFSLPLAEVTANQRRSAKAINFGLIYGMSAFGLAKQLGISRGEAQKYVELYFERYPGVRRYMEETRQQARDRGYVETVFGRRLYLNDISSRNAGLRQGAERAAINAPMQGTAADIIKRAMITVDQWLGDSGIDARLIMQVHDELVFEVRRESADEVIANARRLMCAAAQLNVPLKVDAGIGNNWDEAH